MFKIHYSQLLNFKSSIYWWHEKKRFGSILDSFQILQNACFSASKLSWFIKTDFTKILRDCSKMLFFISEGQMEPLLWNSRSMHVNCANFTPRILIIWFNTWMKNTTFLIFCLFHVWLTDVLKDLKVCTNKAVTKNTNIGSMVFFACTVENSKKMPMLWNGISRISTRIKPNWTMLVTSVITKLIHRYVYHNVEISGFSCHSDFTWNQIRGF